MHLVSIPEAVQLLRTGQLVIIPTETVYGLGADATNPQAIEKIYAYKNRPADNPLICHFASVEQIEEYVTEIPDIARILFQAFAPGPLTILLSVKDSRLQAATRGQAKVGCRIPRSPETLELIRRLDRPVAAPSANPSTRPSSTYGQMALDYFANFPGGVLQAAPAEIGLESTIIDVENNRVRILRQGTLGVQEIQSVLPGVEVVPYAGSTETIPGQKYKHYSPRTPIVKLTTLADFPLETSAVLLTTATHAANYPTKILAPAYYPATIARNLYATLIALDEAACDRAYWYLPELDEQAHPTSLELALREKLTKILE